MPKSRSRSRSRRYETTHPWITFRADLSYLSSVAWMLLGEARSKCEHIAGVPLRPEVAGELYKVYLSKGAYATTSIEGNTLSEEEVRRRLDGVLKLPRSQEYLGREVDNIVDACNQISRELQLDSPVELTPERIKQFNELVLRDLELEEGVVQGQYRTHSVGVMRYLGAPAEDIDFLVEQMCKWLNGPDFPRGDSPFQFTFAVIKAVLAHLYIAWIHPFGDGNGRTARLIEFQLLVQSGMAPLPAGHLLSNHYNTTRSKYYRELDRASGSGGDIYPFVNYAIEGFVDGLREQLSYIRAQQLEVTWENHVHRQFRGKDTQARSRRKHLVLDMPRETVMKADVRHVSTRVAEAYHGKTDKTVTRDLNALVEMGLVRKIGRRYQANRGSILAFLPPQATR
jgi:Fic family protein